jgi:Dyp-type peroxidase family
MRPDIKSTQLGGVASLALLATVKPGFIPGADTVTYARRLEALFKTLAAIRAGSRETSRHASPFPDAVGRFGILQSFRYALVPPEIGERLRPPEERQLGPYRLYLNVTFDGGWETYLRVIYRDLGYLLDTIFCNTLEYKLSSQHSYDEYIRWVRDHEAAAGVLFTESTATVLDGRYLAEVEQLQRQDGDADDARRRIAGMSVPQTKTSIVSLADLDRADPDVRREVETNHMRALKGLYDLRAVYPANADNDEFRLANFAQRALTEFRDYLTLKRGEPRFTMHAEHMAWLLKTLPKEKPPYGADAKFEAADIQPGILERYDGVTHGALLLLRVTDPVLARSWLRTLAAQRGPQPTLEGRLYWNAGFTAAGLRAFGAAAEVVDRLPQEFLEGMEARAGLLGDVRGNHPEHWRRPKLHGAVPVDVDLRSVDLVLQYRLAVPQPGSSAGLHPALDALARTIGQGAHGLQLLAVEAMRSYPTPENFTTEHFGFQDGFSQPQPRWPGVPVAGPRATAFDDGVAPGELFLGHASDREPGRFPDKAERLLDNGSFLVIRKIRQHVRRWRAVLDAGAREGDAYFDERPAEVRQAAQQRIGALLMGRTTDGIPVLDPGLGKGNDYNYGADTQGSRCPFQSHTRRANPRLAGEKMPRIVRRGMSYGPRFDADPDAERGLYFMAYCGSIAEQFEVIQRWMTGGNSSGVLSSHSDPMLGVPQKGTPRSFQWLGRDGEVQRVDLGDQPITELDWGLYLFAPSLAGIDALASGPVSAPAPAPAPAAAAGGCPYGEVYQPSGPVFEERKLGIQGRREFKDEFWKRVVQRCGGHVQTAYGELEARKPQVLAALADHEATTHSVCGFGRRFTETVGPGFLGMDNPEHDRLAVESGIKLEIATRYNERQAYDAAAAATRGVLAQIIDIATKTGQPITIDLVRLSEMVIGRLYAAWWGLPDEKTPPKPPHHMLFGYGAQSIEEKPEARCPRDFVYVARNNFGAHPSDDERAKGRARGRAIHDAVAAYLKSTPESDHVGLTKFIYGQLKGNLDEAINTIGGTMLGFGPSVHQHGVQMLREWVEPNPSSGLSLWDLQVRLLAASPAPGSASYEVAKGALRGPLVKQMTREPVPSVVWREAPGTRLVEGEPEPPKIVLSLHALMNEPEAEALMFGGEVLADDGKELRQPGEALYGVHACPGNGMAIGTLLGLVTTLLQAGTLRRTPSPTIVLLEPVPR